MLARGLIQRRLRGVQACPAVLMCWRGEDRPWLEARTWLRSAPRQHIGEVPLTRTVESLALRSLTVSCWPNGSQLAPGARHVLSDAQRGTTRRSSRARYPVAVTQDGRLTRSAARRRASAGIFYVFSTGRRCSCSGSRETSSSHGCSHPGLRPRRPRCHGHHSFADALRRWARGRADPQGGTSESEGATKHHGASAGRNDRNRCGLDRDRNAVRPGRGDRRRHDRELAALCTADGRSCRAPAAPGFRNHLGHRLDRDDRVLRVGTSDGIRRCRCLVDGHSDGGQRPGCDGHGSRARAARRASFRPFDTFVN